MHCVGGPLFFVFTENWPPILVRSSHPVFFIKILGSSCQAGRVEDEGGMGFNVVDATGRTEDG